MYTTTIPIWKEAPFTRVLVSMIVGIVLEWQLKCAVTLWWAIFLASLLTILFLLLSHPFLVYKLAMVNGASICLLFISMGGLLAWQRDIRHHPGWFGEKYSGHALITVKLEEPLVEKPNSFKALASVTRMEDNVADGEIILYFRKDSAIRQLGYGSRIIFSRAMEPIKNMGNPGGFDYVRYCLFQNITHQVYLKQGDFLLLPGKTESAFTKLLIAIRNAVVGVLRKYIPGEREQGLSEALMIGYKEDLDKNLVQSYSNTGVVHVIAISGLHLGLIYWLLVQFFKPLRRMPLGKWFSSLLILASLWVFSLLAGGQPSVLRSAVMFSCILLAESFSRKSSIYNSLAFSAFVLLCINPYWLWDVGFQLSYAAVLSILIFTKPIYHWLYFTNKIMDQAWKLNSVSIAAQVLTTPISIYHFHQFPNFFLLTNFIVVPLSSVIILGEILLCVVAFLPVAAAILGKMISWLVWFMNSYVERIEQLPFSLWSGLEISVIQCCLIILMIAGIGSWRLKNRKYGAWVGLVSLFLIVVSRSYSFFQAELQQKIIVYNIPQTKAIDLIRGRKCYFVSDQDLSGDSLATHPSIKPSRMLNRVEQTKRLPGETDCAELGSRRILFVDKPVVYRPCQERITIDLLVISKNANVDLRKLVQTFNLRLVVFDASNNFNAVNKWEKVCEAINIPHYDVRKSGAFVMNLH